MSPGLRFPCPGIHGQTRSPVATQSLASEFISYYLIKDRYGWLLTSAEASHRRMNLHNTPAGEVRGIPQTLGTPKPILDESQLERNKIRSLGRGTSQVSRVSRIKGILSSGILVVTDHSNQKT
ncbi:hypothetical protein J6590_092729 [Homalodisca vitripennis]|nr:hypothetical protein J6590_092729 [Homalodisca vitripennis]